MTLRCATCGYRTANSAFFRREKGGVLGLRQTVCLGCGAYQPTTLELSSTVGFWLGLPSLGLFTGMLSAATGSTVDTVIFVGAIVLSWPIYTPIHEAGHAVGAKIAGLHIISLSMGTGPLVWGFRIGGARFELRRYSLGGGRAFFVDFHETTSRWRLALAILGGPLANLAFCGLFMIAAMLLPSDDPFDQTSPAVALVSGLALGQGFAGIFNLIPFRLKRGAVSDGAQLFGLLKATPPPDADVAAAARGIRYLSAGKFREAASAFREAARLNPDSPSMLSMVIHCLSRADGNEAAFRFYVENKEAFDRAESTTNKDEVAYLPWMYANIAWCAAKTGDTSALEIAEPFARRAFEANPDAAEMKGTIGAILIEKGEIDAGYPLLLDATRRINDPIDGADFIRYLAKAERAKGDTSLAEDFENLRLRSLTSAGIPRLA